MTVLPQPGRVRQAAIMGTLAAVLLVVALLIGGGLSSGLIAAALVAGISGVGIARSGIRCDAKGVAVQRLTLTRRFTWAEIAGFENRELDGIGVELQREGGWIRLVGPNMFGERSAEITEQLEQQRRVRQG